MKSTKSFVSTLVLIATLVFLPLSAVYSVAQDQKVPYEEGIQPSVEDCKGAFRAPEDRRVLPTRSCALDRQFKRACGISQDLHQEPSLPSNGGKARRHVRPRGEPLQ